MAGTNFKTHKTVPTSTSTNSTKSNPVTVNFSGGVITYRPNDTMDSDELRLAQDARFDRVGEYGTRKGYKMLVKPLGESQLVTNATSSTKTLTGDSVASASVTIPSDAPIVSIKVTMAKSSTASYVIPRISLSVGGEVVASSCINYTDLTTSQKEFEVWFFDTPNVYTSETASVILSAQTGKLSDLIVTANSNGAMLVKLNTATDSPVGNVFEANIDGTKTILFTHNGKLYRSDYSGNVTLIRTLPSGVTKVRFNQDINKIRYVDGKEEPHILDPSNNWADSEITPKDLKTEAVMEIKPTNIMDGTSDNIIYFDGTYDTQADWTYPYGYTYAKSAAWSTTDTIDGSVGETQTIAKSTITPVPDDIAIGEWITGQGRSTAEVTAIATDSITAKIVDTTPQTISSYDSFCTDFYQNFPAIETGDPLTAMCNLGGVLYFFTRRNKYMMYSQSADSWSQSQSQAQNGTFSQESLVCDLNYAYFASDNGIYVFDGSSEASITQNSIQNVYDAIPNKEGIVCDLYKNRLYVYYASEDGGVNDSCLVYNINLKVWESFDSNSWVSATCARQNTSARFICGHSRVGMLMLAEEGDYSDMGQAINFNLETSYQHFGATSRLKRIVKWRPEFAVSDQPYTIECGYALDFTDNVEYAFSIDLLRQEITNLGYVWDNPSDYGVTTLPTKHTTLPRVNGEFYRCQIRYQHIAAFEPVIFRSHTLSIQTQRLR